VTFNRRQTPTVPSPALQQTAGSPPFGIEPFGTINALREVVAEVRNEEPEGLSPVFLL
jgi:hypothetical protein